MAVFAQIFAYSYSFTKTVPSMMQKNTMDVQHVIIKYILFVRLFRQREACLDNTVEAGFPAESG